MISLFQIVRRPPVWLLIPILGILSAVLAVSWFGAKELMASQALKKQVAKMRAEGLPVDDRTMTTVYEERTHQEGSTKWIEASDLVAILADQGQRALGIDHANTTVSDLSPNDLSPNIEWKDRSRTDAYLNSLQPAIELLKDASAAPKPIWHPIHFNGFSTLLPYSQRAREVANVLKYDAEYAIYISDTKRAIRDLELLLATSLANESDLLVVWFVAQAINEMRWQFIQRSLFANVWSEDELQSVADLIGSPVDIARVWPRLIDSELAMSRSFFHDSDDAMWKMVFGESSAWWTRRFATLPTNQLAYTESTLLWRDVAEEGFDGAISRARELSRAQEGQGNVLVDLLGGPRVNPLAQFLRSEDQRRLTMTAVAIKQFQLRNDTWPEQLSDLETLGSDAKVWSSVESGRFGYRVVDDQAVVWSLTKKPKGTSTPAMEVYEKFSDHKAIPEDAHTWTSTDGSVVTIR